MKLTFNVNYRTEWGESLFLTGSAEALYPTKDKYTFAIPQKCPETYTEQKQHTTTV